MVEFSGRYGSAIVFTDSIEDTAASQIKQIVEHPVSKDSHIRIMPDVHAGLGCVIGYTAKLGDMVIPNLIGVDIGCGVLAFCFDFMSFYESDFLNLERIIRENIPSGTNIKSQLSKYLEVVSEKYMQIDFNAFKKNLIKISKKTNQNINYILNSIGSLGSGNHFIEIDATKDKVCFVVHTGSRNFGLNIAKYHQKKAKKRSKEKLPSGMEYLLGADAKEYMEDMKTAQIFAKLNRYVILFTIIEQFGLDKRFEIVESVHNYINFDDNIIRKGAISAHKDEKVIIPINMADGIVVGKGKGIAEWNFSAPHGAGRIMSRKQAKNLLDLEDFKSSMSGVFSCSVNKKTIDESPMAYKSKEYLLSYLKKIIDIEFIAKPIYNFKAV
jgi:tRNA-splicing ligase RtcB